MGCKHFKDATLVHRVSSVAMPLRPSTPSFHAQNTKLRSGSQTNESKEELPSFVVSDSADLVGSSDGELVHGMVNAFTFSFIQVSETSSTHSSLGDSLCTYVEQTSPGSAEPRTVAMTDDQLELTAIPEERFGLRDGVEASTSNTQQESVESTPSNSSLKKYWETSPSLTAAKRLGESSEMSELAVKGSSELLMYELDAAGISHCSGDSSHNIIDTKRSVTLSKLSEESGCMVTETGDVACSNTSVEPVSEALSDESGTILIECQSIEEFANAIVHEVIDTVLSNTTETTIDEYRRQPQDCETCVASGSFHVEPSSTSLTYLNMKTQQVEDARLPSSRAPIYAIVDTSTKNGVIMYHVQLIDEVTESAKWPTPLLCRYSDFSETHLKLKKTKALDTDKLPSMPRAGVLHFVRGRQSKRTIEERQQQFSNMLRYIAEHRALHDSAVFQSFLAK